MTLEEAQAIAVQNNYLDIKVIDGKAYGLLRMAFTMALVVDVTEDGYRHRYCYPNHVEGVAAFAKWNGVDVPEGNWIKRKGRDGDFANPNYEAS